MSKTKFIAQGTLSAALLTLSAAAAAQVSETQESWSAAPSTFDHFTDADASGDGFLDAGEYEAFVSALASHGDVDAQSLIEGGALETEFAAMDTDGSGLISYGEVYVAKNPATEDEMTDAPAEPETKVMPIKPEELPAVQDMTPDAEEMEKDMSSSVPE